MLLSKWTVCDSKKLKFIKEQEASGLLSSLGTKTPLSKILLLGRLLFWRYWHVTTRYKMNEISTKLLLAGDKFMPEMHLRQPEFIHSVCGPFTKKQGKNIKI